MNPQPQSPKRFHPTGLIGSKGFTDDPSEGAVDDPMIDDESQSDLDQQGGGGM